ncbi:MAG: phosphatase PAP2 family protein [Ignavibacteria bacterium]|nr:phosphatase PAP2 family protein [Ignavibacteria bacterium]
MIFFPVIRLLIFCIILLIVHESIAQPVIQTRDTSLVLAGQKISRKTESETHLKASELVSNFPGLMLHQLTALFRMNGSDVPYVAGGVMITTGLLASDHYMDNRVRNLKTNHNWINNTSPVVTEFGGEYGILLAGAFTGGSIILGSGKGIETSVMLFESLISSGLWTRVGKLITGRERPSATYNRRGTGSGHWSGPIKQLKNPNNQSVSSFDAFPSGHTATIFSIATVFAEQYKDNLIVPIISYSFASLVGVTRMIEHTHWASDVFVGAVIGYLCGQSTVRFNHKQTSEFRKSGGTGKRGIDISFYPKVTEDSKGAGMLVSF